MRGRGAAVGAYRSRCCAWPSWSRHCRWGRRWLGWTGGCRTRGQQGSCDLSRSRRETTEPCQTGMEFAEEQGGKKARVLVLRSGTAALLSTPVKAEQAVQLCWAHYCCPSHTAVLSQPALPQLSQALNTRALWEALFPSPLLHTEQVERIHLSLPGVLIWQCQSKLPGRTHAIPW